MKNNILPIIIAAKRGTLSKGTLYFDVVLTLPSAANTSIIIRDSSGIAVRTLYTIVRLNAGINRIYWDGKDDNGNAVANGRYTAHPVSSNVSFAYQGVIGNSSDALTGSGVHRVYSDIADIIINGTKATYVSSYSERLPSVFSFNLAQPNTKINVFAAGSSTPGTTRLTSDGVNNYYAGLDPNDAAHSFVYATKISDNSKIVFSSGSNYNLTNLEDTFNIINHVIDTNSKITGIAAQAGKDYIYVCRPLLNTISVLSISGGGALVATITSFTNPKSVCYDRARHLWVSSGTNNIARYTVNSDGTLTADGITITGVTDPGKIDVSYDGATVGVIDYATNQIKTFSNSTGAAGSLSIGTGSYATDSGQFNNKFWLKNLGGFCFSPDDSIWVADTGNDRLQHFSSMGTYLDTIQTLQTPYYINVDEGSTGTVFAGFKEFSFDKTVTLSGSTGWAYTKNWEPQIAAVLYNNGTENVPLYDITFERFKAVHTYSDGSTLKTFAFLRRKDVTQGYELVELQPSGSIRFTGVLKDGFIIDKEGALIAGENPNYTDRYKPFIYKFSFTGAFDGISNPVWDNGEQLADFAPITDADELTIANGAYTANRNFLTADNKVIFYQTGVNGGAENYFEGPHIGIMNKGGNQFITKTGTGTKANYDGNFPQPDGFNTRKGVNNNAGGNICALGNFFIASYHGENYNQGQTNYYNVFHSSGAALCQFGTEQTVSDPTEAKAGMEGNALNPHLIPGNNADEMLLLHGGETFKGGITVWKGTGFSSVIVHPPIAITLPSLSILPPVLPGVDLMAGIPYNADLAGSVGAWSFPAASDNYNAKSNVLSYGRNDIDVTIHGSDASTSNHYDTLVALGSNTGLANWNLTCLLNYKGTGQEGGEMSKSIDLLDSAGKVIARLTNTYAYIDGTNDTVEIKANGTTIVTDTLVNIRAIIKEFQAFEVSCLDGAITVKYGSYTYTGSVFESGAAAGSPRQLAAIITGGYNPIGRSFSFKQLRFLNS